MRPQSHAYRRDQRAFRPGWSWLTLLLLGLILLLDSLPAGATHETGLGEIEDRPATVFRRQCIAGTNAGNLCNEDAQCPGSTCSPKNVFNFITAFVYDAPEGDVDDVRDLITEMSEVLLDVTDGQAEIGQVTLINNASSTSQADLLIFPATNDTWWQANSGHYRTGGSMMVSINYVDPAVNQGAILAHEFVHLVFDARDEYESRPGCGATTGAADCPDEETIDGGELVCLMDGNGSELCWGQGDPSDLEAISAGNHDATGVTEQSQCRSNRSCWDQVVWSWPTTFFEPASAPVSGNNGAIVVPPTFVEIDEESRIVLLLDESGSMSLESPSRMERLKVAADDFVTLAEDGTEIGIVSFATDTAEASGRARVPVDPITADRTALKTAIAGLAPDSMTHIGEGLETAKQLVIDAGGVTSNTYVVLMTDGLNNQPPPQTSADLDLQEKVDDFLASGIPVYVTCTGGDVGLQSQCAEIANGTGGFYTDSADASRLPETFVDFQERIAGREAIASVEGVFGENDGESPAFFVDEGSESATFTLVWVDPKATAAMTVIAPDGAPHPSLAMPQGRYLRVAHPEPGEWTLRIDRGRGSQEPSESRFVARAYTENRVNSVRAVVRHTAVLPGGEIYLYAFPHSYGGAITDPGALIRAEVTRPDGERDFVELHDRGRDETGHGDDIPGDGVFTGIYRNTELKGAYTLRVQAEIDAWEQGYDAHERDPTYASPRFLREIRLSAVVADPSDVVVHPEDATVGEPGSGSANEPEGWVNGAFILILLLLAILIFVIWICCKRKFG